MQTAQKRGNTAPDNARTNKKKARMRVQDVMLIKRASFMDFLRGGVNIMMALAIDFTASNESPTSPTSLHSLNLSKSQTSRIEDNQYLQAIMAVGTILEAYDSDKNIPVLGYGAQLPGMNDTYHCFALNGNIFAPEIYTIRNVAEVYKANLAKLYFNGPTNFAPCIRYVGDMAAYYLSQGQVYNYVVMLILTDGDISDIDETIEEVVRCSELPMSIVIVGVGNNQFTAMNVLDADQTRLYSEISKRSAARDIVQFVPFRNFAANPDHLARETLHEIPYQLTEYMSQRNIQPLSAPPPSRPPPVSFFDVRKKSFSQHLAQLQYPPQYTDTILAQGYPVEDASEIAPAISGQYQNHLTGHFQ